VGQGRGYLQRAGERAFQRSANQEAVALLEQAIHAAQRLGDRPDVLERAIDQRFLLQLALFTLGEHARIREVMLQAQALAERLGDPRHQARVANALATNSYVTGDHALVLRTARRGLELAEAVGDPAMRFSLRLRLGFAHHARAELDAGIAALGEALAILARDGTAYEYQTTNAIPSVHARTWLVWCLADRGDLVEAAGCAREARATADARRQPYSQVMATWGPRVRPPRCRPHR
jgi:tetratricopeptide (TPR) repeat protein